MTIQMIFGGGIQEYNSLSLQYTKWNLQIIDYIKRTFCIQHSIKIYEGIVQIKLL